MRSDVDPESKSAPPIKARTKSSWTISLSVGTDALQFLRTPVESAQGDYVAVARSFALSHAVEALAAIAVLVLLRSDLAEERRRLKRA